MFLILDKTRWKWWKWNWQRSSRVIASLPGDWPRKQCKHYSGQCSWTWSHSLTMIIIWICNFFSVFVLHLYVKFTYNYVYSCIVVVFTCIHGLRASLQYISCPAARTNAFCALIPLHPYAFWSSSWWLWMIIVIMAIITIMVIGMIVLCTNSEHNSHTFFTKLKGSPKHMEQWSYQGTAFVALK